VKRSGRDWAPPRSRAAGHRIGRGYNAKAPSLWRQVVEALPAPIAVVDTQGCIIAMNEAFRSRVRRGAGNSQMEIDDLDDNLMAAIRTAAWGPPSQVYRSSSAWGVLFECRRLEEQAGLVALIAEAIPSKASYPAGSG
jgi:PAS domain-containing protein